MDVFSTEWQHELEMQDFNLMLQCQTDSADHSQISFKCFSPEVYSSYASLNNERAHIETGISELAQELNTTTTNNNNFDNNENVILFGQEGGSPSTRSEQFNGDQNNTAVAATLEDDDRMCEKYINNLLCLSSPSSEENKHDTSETSKRAKRVCAPSRAPCQAKNHILAERKRRERLSQRLISLSALIPGLKKMDKVSILEDAIKYIKQLREHVQTLEKKEGKKKLVDVEPTVLFVKKCRGSCDDESTVSSDENLVLDENIKKLSRDDIEVRVSGKNVLVRIYCQKSCGVTSKILSEMQALHLNVITTSVLPFGDTVFVITTVAQMDDECNLTVMDLEKTLRLAFLNNQVHFAD